jgi:hypothetical protein
MIHCMVLPYLKGLVIIKCGFFYLALWIYCVFSIFGDYICRSIQVLKVLKNGIRALSLADIVGKYFLFLQFFFFFRRRKKRAATFLKFFWYISVQNLQKQVSDLSSSQKNTQVEKKNRLKRSPRSQDIEVLKSAIFKVFSVDGGTIFFFLSSSWRPNLPKQITDLSSSHNFTQFKKKNQPKRSLGSEVMSILNSTVF